MQILLYKHMKSVWKFLFYFVCDKLNGFNNQIFKLHITGSRCQSLKIFMSKFIFNWFILKNVKMFIFLFI